MSTPQLEILLNSVLKAEDGEKVPYSFHIDDKEVVQELGAHLLHNKVWSSLFIICKAWSCSSCLLEPLPGQGACCTLHFSALYPNPSTHCPFPLMPDVH